MDSDDAFVKVMNECWSLHANAPAPPVFRLRHGTASFDRAPMAIQTHGDFISWQQDSSMLEDESLRIESQKGKKVLVALIVDFCHTIVTLLLYRKMNFFIPGIIQTLLIGRAIMVQK